ncbi:GNAT family N-acetyltransferase [Vibrio tubiashii]|uniref:GNAT family N-acetyltransferase n=1 Tax=Vibrio tubiashii TaxID=29498 RepID=UPI001EFD1C6B|nr:GNAT family N-acetyltransferase [Vibrio tubiashii]MCG9582761.1 GNAT family N-acetyltransferase [Vibrio tubiashii]MCG9616354.1 GNAT family N-acetyltransferase [Vibrio tubiashii]MCG9689584.1 GNAT family N-acetyltransferase [Vibrio tubiashii]
MQLVFNPASDARYAESLTLENMSAYYQSRGIEWDHQRFLESWEELDNFEICVDEERVGLVRFSYDQGETTYLRDFQLEPQFQGRGYGSKSISLIKQHARERASSIIILRVFIENPAVQLYQAHGFSKSSENNGLMEMVCRL